MKILLPRSLSKLFSRGTYVRISNRVTIQVVVCKNEVANSNMPSKRIHSELISKAAKRLLKLKTHLNRMEHYGTLGLRIIKSRA